MSPRVIPKEQRTSQGSSYAEFRSRREQRGEHFASANRSDSFWRYLVSKGPLVETPLGDERLGTMS
jgi:hypothetical protein